MKKIFLFFLLSFHSLFAGEIKIAVAANMSDAIDALKMEFVKTNPQTKVQVTISSSGKLASQIRNGAPYGLFMSADMGFPATLYEHRDAITEPIIYAEGTLAYLSAKKQDFSKGIALLEAKEIQKIAIANPKTAPYGTAAVEAFINAGIYKNIQPKFVYAESISQAVSYSIVAADIGIIAKSSLYGKNMKHYKENENFADVDSKLYTPIQQGMVLLKYAIDNPEYKAFYDFILSDKAKEIFRKYGYIVR